MTSYAERACAKASKIIHSALRAEIPGKAAAPSTDGQDPVDLSGEIGEHLAAILDFPADVYDRRRDLRKLLPIVPDDWIVHNGDMSTDVSIISALGIELAAETHRGLTADPLYSGTRFMALQRALRVEVEAFNLICAVRYSEI